ncbi:MAG: glycosyltransferase [Candidatus Hodarchaeota archaeon]
MEDLLTICAVNYNSSEFILNTLYCLEKTTKNKYKVIIRDNNSRREDFLNLEKGIQIYPNVDLYRVENFHYEGSLAHGIAMNDLILKIDTKYGVILDADCTFLYNNWDEILINEINSEYPIIGTQAPVGYGSKKEFDFPLMYAILFDTKILKSLNIDFEPENPALALDTGHQLRKKYLKEGYKGKLLYYKNTRDYKLGPFKKLICAEYYFNGIKEIFACHFGRGSTLGASKYLKKKNKESGVTRSKIKYIIPYLGSKLLILKGKKEKKKWIKICKEIVNQFL